MPPNTIVVSIFLLFVYLSSQRQIYAHVFVSIKFKSIFIDFVIVRTNDRLQLEMEYIFKLKVTKQDDISFAIIYCFVLLATHSSIAKAAKL